VVLWTLSAGLLGALIGSFANVVIYRLPRGASVVWPGSHCPRCGRALGALELVPVVSWVLLGGRCRGCRGAVSARYPLVELLMALGFSSLVVRYPPERYGLTALPLLALLTLLVILSLIDLDTHTLPDVLTLPALAVALLGSFVYAPGSGLPDPRGALLGSMLGAGGLVLLNRLGALALRRGRDTKERLWPLGMDQVNVAALGGAVGGLTAGLAAAALSLAFNLALRRTLRLSEGTLYGLWAAALFASPLSPIISPLGAAVGTLGAAGAVAILGGLYWWLRDWGQREDPSGDPAATPDADGVAPENAAKAPSDDADEPVAMGFGDVKLAAVLGALLGPQNLAVGSLLAFVLGAVGGVALQALGGARVVPFGPYLVLGALGALLFGDALAAWYLGLLGL
jgi:leader peptidase (prepilin peptidase)/N-methyltransferase